MITHKGKRLPATKYAYNTVRIDDAGTKWVSLGSEWCKASKESRDDAPGSAEEDGTGDEGDVDDDDDYKPPLRISNIGEKRKISAIDQKKAQKKRKREGRNRQRPWRPLSGEEDDALRNGVERHGKGRWQAIRQANTVLEDRCSDEIRYRWKKLNSLALKGKDHANAYSRHINVKLRLSGGSETPSAGFRGPLIEELDESDQE